MLVFVKEHIVNTDCIVQIRKLNEPLWDGRNQRHVTHVIAFREDVKGEFTRDIFTDEAGLHDIYEHMLATRGEYVGHTEGTAESNRRPRRRRSTVRKTGN